MEQRETDNNILWAHYNNDKPTVHNNDHHQDDEEDVVDVLIFLTHAYSARENSELIPEAIATNGHGNNTAVCESIGEKPRDKTEATSDRSNAIYLNADQKSE